MFVLEFYGKRVGIKDVGRDTEVDEDLLSIDEFLGHDTSDGEHRQSSMLELLGGHCGELLKVVRLESERIKANVTGVVRVPQHQVVVVAGGLPSLEGPAEFGGTDDDRQHFKKEWRGGPYLVEVANRRPNVPIDGLKKGVELDGLFRHQESQKGQHGDAAVGGFGLAIGLHLSEVSAVGESERVKFLDGIERSGEAVGELGLVWDPPIQVTVVAGTGSDIQRGRGCRSRSLHGREGRSGGKCCERCEKEFHTVVFVDALYSELDQSRIVVSWHIILVQG